MKIKNNKKAFSLVEIMIVMLILMVFFAISKDFIVNGFRSLRFSEEQETAVEIVRKTLSNLISEAREATQSDRGDYLIASATPKSLIFFSNIDEDDKVEKIRYFQEGLYFKKGITKATGTPLDYYDSNEEISIVSEYINNQTEPIFTYFDVHNNEISDPGSSINDIRMIYTDLMVNVTPHIQPNDYHLNTYIHVRNLKDNL